MAFKKAIIDPNAPPLRGSKSYVDPKKGRRKRAKKPMGPHTLKRTSPNRMGPLTNEDRKVVEAVAMSVRPTDTPEEIQRKGRALGIALGKSPKAIENAIIKAHEKFAMRAEAYVDLHMEATVEAAAQGDAKPAQWALEHIVGKDEKGKKVRIVEPAEKAADSGPRMPIVNIGVQLGGIAPGASLTPIIRTEVIDVEDDMN